MTTQLDLFSAPAERGASRRDDPQTSRDAGRSMSGHTLRSQQALVLESVGSGATAWQVHCELKRRGHDVQQNVAGKRLGELVALGYVRDTGTTRPGRSSRPMRVYALTAQGVSWLVGATA